MLRAAFLQDKLPKQVLTALKKSTGKGYPVGLQGVLISGHEDRLQFATTDLETLTVFECGGGVFEEGSVAVFARSFCDLHPLLSPERVDLDETENILTAVCGCTTTRYKKLPLDDFPPIPEIPALAITLPDKLMNSIKETQLLHDGLNTVMICKNDSRYTYYIIPNTPAHPAVQFTGSLKAGSTIGISETVIWQKDPKIDNLYTGSYCEKRLNPEYTLEVVAKCEAAPAIVTIAGTLKPGKDHTTCRFDFLPDCEVKVTYASRETGSQSVIHKTDCQMNGSLIIAASLIRNLPKHDSFSLAPTRSPGHSVIRVSGLNLPVYDQQQEAIKDLLKDYKATTDRLEMLALPAPNGGSHSDSAIYENADPEQWPRLASPVRYVVDNIDCTWGLRLNGLVFRYRPEDNAPFGNEDWRRVVDLSTMTTVAEWARIGKRKAMVQIYPIYDYPDPIGPELPTVTTGQGLIDLQIDRATVSALSDGTIEHSRYTSFTPEDLQKITPWIESQPDYIHRVTSNPSGVRIVLSCQPAPNIYLTFSYTASSRRNGRTITHFTKIMVSDTRIPAGNALQVDPDLPEATQKGIDYENAGIAHDFPRMIALENWLNEKMKNDSDCAYDILFVRGRNMVREQKGVDPVSLW